MSVLDLRGFVRFVEQSLPREHLVVADELSASFELAAITSALQEKMRMPLITYNNIDSSSMPVLHNACASLARIAKSVGITAPELELRLDAAYDNLIPPVYIEEAPVREVVFKEGDVDLRKLPAVRYTESEKAGYLSAAQVVAVDRESGKRNISFHRLMIFDKNTLAIYMTGGGHLSAIHEANKRQGKDTPVAVFIGAHPLWSLGSLAAGSLDLDEFEVIGGLLEEGLPVTAGLLEPSLAVPAYAELALEGIISSSVTLAEGPYGEAFGFVSDVQHRPALTVMAMSHRENPLFQDIVPGKLEHLTMTGIAVQVHLRKALLKQFSCIESIHLPSPMTVYVSLNSESAGEQDVPVHEILDSILREQRFVKHVVVFDHDVDTTNSKQTQRALSMFVQADRDFVIIPELAGNGLDPSERNELTTKWGIDARSAKPGALAATKNQLPFDTVAGLDLSAILERAKKERAKKERAKKLADEKLPKDSA